MAINNLLFFLNIQFGPRGGKGGKRGCIFVTGINVCTMPSGKLEALLVDKICCTINGINNPGWVIG